MRPIVSDFAGMDQKRAAAKWKCSPKNEPTRVVVVEAEYWMTARMRASLVFSMDAHQIECVLDGSAT